MLERDLSKTVILDNAPHTFPYHVRVLPLPGDFFLFKLLVTLMRVPLFQLMNTIPIKSWCGDKEDKELQKLVPYLEKLAQAVSSVVCFTFLGSRFLHNHVRALVILLRAFKLFIKLQFRINSSTLFFLEWLQDCPQEEDWSFSQSAHWGLRSVPFLCVYNFMYISVVYRM